MTEKLAELFDEKAPIPRRMPIRRLRVSATARGILSAAIVVFVSILVSSASPQPAPRAPDGPIHITINAQEIEALSRQSEPHPVRTARISRRLGSSPHPIASSAGFRRCGCSPTASISFHSPTRAAGCADASRISAGDRSRSKTSRWRRSSDPTAGRWRRADGTTPIRSRSTAARFTSVLNGSTASCVSITGGRDCSRAGSRFAPPWHCEPSQQQGTRVPGVRPIPMPGAGTLIADLGTRSRQRGKYPGIPDWRAQPGQVQRSASR